MKSSNATGITAIVILFVAAVAYRLALGLAPAHSDWLPNFAPLSAIALCGALFFPRRLAFLLPLGALLVSDALLDLRLGIAFFSVESLARYVALALVACIGFALRPRPTAGRILGGTVTGSALFYTITNTGSWLLEPAYAKTFAGWVQALSVGLPGYAPTYLFFRNTLVSDLLFTALFVLCFARTANRKVSPVYAAHAPSS
jgi:hypothetical protein